MKAVCAWCQRDEQTAIRRDIDPLGKTIVTHGICRDHAMALRAQARRSLGATA
jgi:hypothetical protein